MTLITHNYPFFWLKMQFFHVFSFNLWEKTLKNQLGTFIQAVQKV